MWALIIFIGFILANGIAADVKGELQKCINKVDVENLANFMALEESHLDFLCPLMAELFDCIDEVIYSNVGFRMADLAANPPTPEVRRGAEFFVNVRNLFTDLCTKGTDLNDAYTANAECLERIHVDDKECEATASAAYEAYKEFEDNGMRDNQLCMVQAYKFACLGAQVHEQCGQSSFEVFQTLVKRSSLFSHAFCTKEQIAEVQTKFLDSLELEEERKNIYRLAFDLRKRRK